jgi:hypothetical protein
MIHKLKEYLKNVSLIEHKNILLWKILLIKLKKNLEISLTILSEIAKSSLILIKSIKKLKNIKNKTILIDLQYIHTNLSIKYQYIHFFI